MINDVIYNFVIKNITLLNILQLFIKKITNSVI